MDDIARALYVIEDKIAAGTVAPYQGPVVTGAEFADPAAVIARLAPDELARASRQRQPAVCRPPETPRHQVALRPRTAHAVEPHPHQRQPTPRPRAVSKFREPLLGARSAG